MMHAKRGILRSIAGFAVAFGVLTVLTGGMTLAGRVEMGTVVWFVLWFNFMAGFAYVLGGVLLWRRSSYAFLVAFLICVATLLVFATFGLYAASGGDFEIRTVGALTVRSTFWIIMSFAARKV